MFFYFYKFRWIINEKIISLRNKLGKELEFPTYLKVGRERNEIRTCLYYTYDYYESIGGNRNK